MWRGNPDRFLMSHGFSLHMLLGKKIQHNLPSLSTRFTVREKTHTHTHTHTHTGERNMRSLLLLGTSCQIVGSLSTQPPPPPPPPPSLSLSSHSNFSALTHPLLLSNTHTHNYKTHKTLTIQNNHIPLISTSLRYT